MNSEFVSLWRKRKRLTVEGLQVVKLIAPNLQTLQRVTLYLFFNWSNNFSHFFADLRIKHFRLMLCQNFTSFPGCPIACIIFLRFPFAVRTAIHELGHIEFAHMFASVLLR